MLGIRAGRAFDGERAIPGGALVLVDDGRILAVEYGTNAAPDGCEVHDFPDGTVLPGLIDTHVHLCGDSRTGALDRLADYGDSEMDDVITAGLRLQLAAGVTIVRDLGDRRFAVLDRRNARAEGNGVPAPTILAAGPPITSRHGHCWNMGGEATGSAGLRAAVRERAERGVNVVKIMASGGAMTPGTDVMLCQFDTEELALVVAEAHAVGLPVTAHAHGLPAVEQAVLAGVDGIEHCTCLVPTGITMPEQLLERLAERRVVVCPTLGRAPGAVPPPAMRAHMERTGLTWEARQRQAGKLYDAGVPLVSGSDSGISEGKPHGILPESIADFVAGGVPATAAIASATSTAAAVCGLGDRKGWLRAGYDADLVVIGGDPLTNISALHDVRAVVLHGHVV